MNYNNAEEITARIRLRRAAVLAIGGTIERAEAVAVSAWLAAADAGACSVDEEWPRIWRAVVEDAEAHTPPERTR